MLRLRNLSFHSPPVVWCSWELVFYSLPPPVHHGDSLAAKELLSPLLSPRIIFAHRIQSTAGRIWPLIERFDCCATVPCDSALIRWQIGVRSAAGFISLWRFPIAAQGSRITCKLKEMSAVVTYDEEQLCPIDSLSISARDKVCASEGAEASAGTYFDVTHLKLSLWLSVGFLVAPALETQRFRRTNISVCFCRVV